MTNRAIIDCQLVDFRNDDRHKGFIKITLHLPTERGGAFHAMLCGRHPTYTDPIPVALAQLNFQPAKEKKAEIEVPAAAPNRSPPVTPEFLDIVNKCKNPGWRAKLEDAFKRMLPEGCHINNEEEAADLVKHLCQVPSRREIRRDTPAWDRWERIELRIAERDRELAR